jgi:hypothetical protein
MAAHHCRIQDDIAEAICNLVADAVDGASTFGEVKIYTGSEPATANAAAATLVATCIADADPAFGAAEWVVGTGCWEATNADTFTCASATGNASAVTHFRLTDSDDVVVLQGTCSATTGDDLVLTGAVIVASAEVVITDLVIAVPINQA